MENEKHQKYWSIGDRSVDNLVYITSISLNDKHWHDSQKSSFAESSIKTKLSKQVSK